MEVSFTAACGFARGRPRRRLMRLQFQLANDDTRLALNTSETARGGKRHVL